MDQSRTNGLPATVNFLHIPKTAGITFNNLLVNLFDEDEVYVSGVFQLIEKLKRGEKFDNSHIRYFRAHFQYAPYFFTQPVQYVTMLRDPVKQVLSSIKQLIRAEGEPYHYAWKNIKSFKALFTSQAFGSGYWNLQTRMVSGYLNFDQNPAVQYDGNRPFDDPFFFDKAIENLEKFAFFGITSRFNDSLDLLENKMGWVLDRTPRKNITPEFFEYEFTKEDIELIKEKNQLDQQLYDYAVEMFAGKFEDLKKELGTQAKTERAVSIDASATNAKFEDHEIRPTIRSVKRYLNSLSSTWKNLTILEINPYFGFTQKKLKNYYQVIQGSDQISESETLPSVKLVDPTSLDFEDNFFDIIICLDTIDCLLYPERVIEEFLRVLKLDGKLVLSVPVKKFVNDDRSKRSRSTEIEGQFQPLYPQKFRKSAFGSDMLVALEFSKNLDQIFGRWANQPVKIIDVPDKKGLEKIIVIHKKYIFDVGKYEEIRIKELEQLLEKDRFSLPIRLDIYHEIMLMQEKLIDMYASQITKAHLAEK